MRAVLAAIVLSILPIIVHAEEPPTKPKIQFNCWVTSHNLKVVNIMCRSIHAPSVPEWRLFGSNEDQLTDYTEGWHFRFECPREWRLLEMKTWDGDTLIRVRHWIRCHAGQFQGQEYGKEGE